ncbi:MAG TPA: hypothetical protein VGK46_01780 [Saprospiraceae bacterium]
MKLHYLLLASFFLNSTLFLSAQKNETLQPPAVHTTNRYVNTNKIIAQPQQAPVFLDPRTVSSQPKWDVTLTQHGVSHASQIPATQLDSIKQEGRRIRHYRDSIELASGIRDYELTEVTENKPMSITPFITNSFKGNQFNGWAPPDNSVAVSDAGYVVSVINSSVLVMDAIGNVLMEENFEDLFSVLELNGGYFDPKVLYDPEEDKFIIVVLNGNTPATSRVVLGFSTESNPANGWWLYAYHGDPGGFNLWFDFPSVGISTDDIYISGNQFTENKVFSQTLIYQLGKSEGFRGESISGVIYYDVKDAYGYSDFTIVPMSYGFDGSVGPGIFMLSTNGNGGSEAMLYYVDANAQSNPSIYAYTVSIPNYYVPFNGLMLGTTDELKTNDCNTLTGFYADGTVHFAFNTRGDDFHTKIYYCRLNTEDLTNTTLLYGLQPYEYAFPSISPFATEETDKSVLIGFLRTSSTIYPEFRIMAVDHDMNFGNSYLVKGGESYVDVDASASERWGDYIGISRRESVTGPEVWVSGSYGKDQENGEENLLCTWIAQVTSTETVSVAASDTLLKEFNLFPNPVSGGRINVEFEITNASVLDFLVVDEQGRMIRNLLHRNVKAGLNQFSFSPEPLSPGAYYLVIHDQTSSLLKSQKFIVAY